MAPMDRPAILKADYSKKRIRSDEMNEDVFLASENGDVVKLQRLLKADAGLVTAYNADGWTALHLAAHYGQLEAAEVLLSHGADSDARSHNGMDNIPLHAAVAGNHLELVKLLVGDGSDVNAQQHGGWTPLHGAAQHGNYDMAAYLLKSGADPEIPNDDGLTAYDIAMEEGHDEVAELLRTEEEDI
jgi:ankyrin repeat protein